MPIFIGDINNLFKEEDDEIDKTIDEQNRNAHQRANDDLARWRRQ